MHRRQPRAADWADGRCLTADTSPITAPWPILDHPPAHANRGQDEGRPSASLSVSIRHPAHAYGPHAPPPSAAVCVTTLHAHSSRHPSQVPRLPRLLRPRARSCRWGPGASSCAPTMPCMDWTLAAAVCNDAACAVSPAACSLKLPGPHTRRRPAPPPLSGTSHTTTSRILPQTFSLKEPLSRLRPIHRRPRRQ